MKSRAEGRLLDAVLPDAPFVGRVSTRVEATPRRVFDALRRVTTADMPLATFLGNLRYLPRRLSGKSGTGEPPREPFLDELARNGTAVLSESRNVELVLGTIGKFHQVADQEFVMFDGVQAFRRFSDPAYQKLAMSVRIEDAGERDCKLVLEHRTLALGPASERRFARYWMLIHPMGNFVSWLLLRAVKRLAEQGESRQPAA